MKKLLILLLISISWTAQAQQLLTIDDAIAKALKNNYNILVARTSADIDKLNNTMGNAGMLPNVSVNGSGAYQQNDVTLKTAVAGETHTPNVSTKNIGANVELNWKLFDGGKMFVTKNKLNEIAALGELQFREQLMQTVYNIVAAYYDVVRQQQQLKAITEAINFNRERVKIAQLAFTSGAVAKTDLLQAKIDLNVFTENAVNQQAAILAAKRMLNVLLGENREVDFAVSEEIPLNYQPDKAELYSKLLSVNPSLLAVGKQKEIARLAVKENERAYLPQLNFRTGYYLSNTDNSAGQTLLNKSYGPQIGGTLSIPLFTGGETRRKVNVAQQELKSAEFTLENTKIALHTELQNALTEFDNQKQLVVIEAENILLTKENLDISLSRLRLGQTTSLEVHLAQESFVQSATRLTNFKYNLKVAEAKLKQLLAEF